MTDKEIYLSDSHINCLQGILLPGAEALVDRINEFRYNKL